MDETVQDAWSLKLKTRGTSGLRNREWGSGALELLHADPAPAEAISRLASQPFATPCDEPQ